MSLKQRAEESDSGCTDARDQGPLQIRSRNVIDAKSQAVTCPQCAPSTCGDETSIEAVKDPPCYAAFVNIDIGSMNTRSSSQLKGPSFDRSQKNCSNLGNILAPLVYLKPKLSEGENNAMRVRTCADWPSTLQCKDGTKILSPIKSLLYAAMLQEVVEKKGFTVENIFLIFFTALFDKIKAANNGLWIEWARAAKVGFGNNLMSWRTRA